jgi:uncharacterized damage-inducible protein DinB
MTPIEEQIIETWDIHHRIMLLAIDSIAEDAMKASLSTRGGRDIAKQFAHINNVRTAWVEAFAKKSDLTVIIFGKNESPAKKELLEAFTLSGEVMSAYLKQGLANGGKVTGFKRGVVPMLGYLISHEAHHLGHAILTMKQSGFKIPEPLKWDIWDWNKV